MILQIIQAATFGMTKIQEFFQSLRLNFDKKPQLPPAHPFTAVNFCKQLLATYLFNKLLKKQTSATKNSFFNKTLWSIS